MIKNLRANLRAATRAAIGIAAFFPTLGLVALQGFVVGPVTGNYTAIPNFIYNSMRKLLGFKIEFNAASAPLVKDKPVWFVANHTSMADFIVAGSTLRGTFAGKNEITKWPGISQMVRAVKFIGLRRSREYNPESRGKIIKNFNAGFNTIMFPEATTTPGDEVYQFRAALPALLFGEKGVDEQGKEVSLDRKVVVQPIAIRVKDVNGQDATGNAALRDLYIMYKEEDTLRRIWKRMMVRDMTIELTAFPPMKAADYNDAKELMNAAARQIASIVNPGQTIFRKAIIPGQKPKVSAPPENAPL